MLGGPETDARRRVTGGLTMWSLLGWRAGMVPSVAMRTVSCCCDGCCCGDCCCCCCCCIALKPRLALEHSI